MAAILFFAALVVLPRADFFSRWHVNFDADEALVALHAQQLWQGRLDLFLPGQNYMGSLHGAIAGLLMLLFGPHPNVARLAPALWLLPGFLALLHLERLGRGRLGRGRGVWFLAALWFLPPAVLFFGGCKVRGGMLESIVLGLWSAVLFWPRSGPENRSRAVARWFAGGILFGLSLWTHTQILLLAPWILLVWLSQRAQLLQRLLAVAIGFALGYLPLWIPQLMPAMLGPPGMSQAHLDPSLSAIFTAASFRTLGVAFDQALRAGGSPAGFLRAAHWLQLGMTVVCVALAAGLFLRQPRTAWRDHPVLGLALCLGAGTLAVLVVSPVCLSDEGWHRYTICLCLLLAYAPAFWLSRLPRLLGWPVLGLLVGSTLLSYREAEPGWVFPHDQHRVALVETLEERGIRRVISSWRHAYFIQFLSYDVILCASRDPLRYPEITATVDFAAEAWHVRGRQVPLEKLPSRTRSPIEDEFLIRQRTVDPPPEVTAEFARLDPQRTLFAHLEPWPLLAESEYGRDWRGWPYRRPLTRFTAIVWQPQHSGGLSVSRDRVVEQLEALVSDGEFEITAQWREQMILRRTGLPTPVRF